MKKQAYVSKVTGEVVEGIGAIIKTFFFDLIHYHIINAKWEQEERWTKREREVMESSNRMLKEALERLDQDIAFVDSLKERRMHL